MKTVWKYDLTAAMAIEMPAGASVLCVAEQFGRLCLWALVDPVATLEWRVFKMFGTGHPIHDVYSRYCGTAYMDQGSLVLHVFESTGEPK